MQLDVQRLTRLAHRELEINNVSEDDIQIQRLIYSGVNHFRLMYRCRILGEDYN